MANSIDDEPTPVDIIFNCAICNAILPDVYREVDLDKGFRDAADRDHQEPVTKMWLSECTHFFCGEHLEGGGVPFHKKGETPRAACPACIATKGDKSKKALYGVRGVDKGQYDHKIPKNWFDTPPVALTTEGKGMDAMRFHYLSLVRFGCQMVSRARRKQEGLDDALLKASREAESKRLLAANVDALHARVKDLEQCEKELKPWKERESKIKHYLGLFGEISRENEKLREQLTAMGYAVPKRTYSVELGVSERDRPEHPFDSQLEPRNITTSSLSQVAADSPDSAHRTPHDMFPGNTPSSRTASGGDQAPVANLHAARVPQGAMHSNKRQRTDEDTGHTQQRTMSPRPMRGSSRDLMPPPPLPFRRPTQLTPMKRAPFMARANASTFDRIDHPAIETHEGHPPLYKPLPNGPFAIGTPSRPPSRSDWLPQSHNTMWAAEPMHTGLAPADMKVMNSPGRQREVLSRHFTHASTQEPLSTPGPGKFFPQRLSESGPTHVSTNLGQYPYQGHADYPLMHQQNARRDPSGDHSSRAKHNTTLPSTPSPLRQSRTQRPSVASPFFRRTTNADQRGRITLSDPVRSVSRIGHHFNQGSPERPSVDMRGAGRLGHASNQLSTPNDYTPLSSRAGTYAYRTPQLPPDSRSKQCATPAVRHTLAAPHQDRYEHSSQSRGVAQRRNVLQSMKCNVLSNSGHRSGASKAFSEWAKDKDPVPKHPAPQSELHLGDLLGSSSRRDATDRFSDRLGRRAIRR